MIAALTLISRDYKKEIELNEVELADQNEKLRMSEEELTQNLEELKAIHE
jgi:hypothetical protein